MRRTLSILAAVLVCAPAAASAQFPGMQGPPGPAFTTDNPVIRSIYALGMDSSQTYRLAQVLLDSIGPRLVGSPAYQSAGDWLVSTYRSWGITARQERYGTWAGWRRGRSYISLMAPRVRTLEGTQLAFSPNTGGRPVRGEVVLLPDVADSAAFRAWLPNARGKFVAINYPEPTCRPDTAWHNYALQNTYDQMRNGRQAARTAWAQRITKTGASARTLPLRLEEAGAVGVLTSQWTGGYGVTRVFNAYTRRVPTFDLSCEDYGLVARLAINNQHPQVEAFAESEALGDQSTFNVIAEIPGSELPNEYVLLSAHLDSWDGGSGATDNGTGTVVMMEAMRILKQVYPNPRRTVLVGHWDSEEQGLNGSRAFAADHPNIVEGLQAAFNQDNGTGRIATISAAGLWVASGNLARWLSQVPGALIRNLTFGMPGSPSGGGSDNASFICSGAPAFGVGSSPWDYFQYTWHTGRDTFDKLSFDDVKMNATLVATLTYLASEDRERVSRERRSVLPGQGGQPGAWPTCGQPMRTGPASPQ
ncbi:MAG: M28 family peptidase [Gemmatimonadota bacterium]